MTIIEAGHKVRLTWNFENVFIEKNNNNNNNNNILWTRQVWRSISYWSNETQTQLTELVTLNVHSNLSAPTVTRFYAIFKVVEAVKYLYDFEDERMTLNVGNGLTEGGRQLLRTRHRWKDNIKMCRKEKGLWIIRVCTDYFWRWSSESIWWTQ